MASIGVVNHKVPNFLAMLPSETINAIQVGNSLIAIHPIIIMVQLIRDTSYVDMRKPALEEY